MATVNQNLIADAEAAWYAVDASNSTLAHKLRNDFKAAGYVVNVAVSNDLNQVSAMGGSFVADGDTLRRFYSNRSAVQESINTGLGTTLLDLASNLGNAAGKAGKAATGLGAAVPKGSDVLPHVDIPGFLSALVNPHTWLRVGEAVMGLMLLAIGVGIMAKSSPAGSAVIKAGKAVIK